MAMKHKILPSSTCPLVLFSSPALTLRGERVRSPVECVDMTFLSPVSILFLTIQELKVLEV